MKRSRKSGTSGEVAPGARLPYISGHCGNGAHEGSKTFSEKGTMYQPCRGRYEFRFGAIVITCTCWCHGLAQTVRDMNAPIAVPDTILGPEEAVTVAASGLEMPLTVAANVPEVEIIVRDPHWMYRRMIASDKVSSQLVNLVRVRILQEDTVEVERSKIHGRRRRGELEPNVEIVCRLWLDGMLPWELLTTDAISMIVDADDPPSQGAIHSVLNRWADKGLAMIGTKPIRFMGFNDSVLELGVEEASARVARQGEKRAKGHF